MEKDVVVRFIFNVLHPYVTTLKTIQRVSDPRRGRKILHYVSGAPKDLLR